MGNRISFRRGGSVRGTTIHSPLGVVLGLFADKLLNVSDAVQRREGSPVFAQGRAEHVDMGVDETGEDGSAFEINHLGGRRAVGSEDFLGRAGGDEAALLDGDGLDGGGFGVQGEDVTVVQNEIRGEESERN